MFRSLPEMVVVAPRPKKKSAKKVFGDRRGLGFRHLVVKPANLGHVLFYRQRKPPKPKHGRHTFNRGSLGFWPIKLFPIQDNGHVLIYRQRKPPKPKHGRRTYNGQSVGFWPVPDLGYAFSGALTLPMLRASGILRLEQDLIGGVTLNHLSVHGEVRYGPDNNPGRVTLKMLTVSGTLIVQAPTSVSHAIYTKYNSRGGGPVVSWVKNYKGSRQIQIKRSIPAQTSDQEFDVSILEATTLALTLYSTQDVTVELNSGHTQTIHLGAQEAIIWTSDSGDPFPFTSNVSALFVSNAGLSAANFTIAALILDSSN